LWCVFVFDAGSAGLHAAVPNSPLSKRESAFTVLLSVLHYACIGHERIQRAGRLIVNTVNMDFDIASPPPLYCPEKHSRVGENDNGSVNHGG
jgi:hypothetical protein